MIVRLRREDKIVIAVLDDKIVGYGETVPEALRDLAAAIQNEESASPGLKSEPPRVLRLKIALPAGPRTS